MRGMPCASHTSWLGTDEGDRSDLDESLSGHGSDSRTCVNDSGLHLPDNLKCLRDESRRHQ